MKPSNLALRRKLARLSIASSLVLNFFILFNAPTHASDALGSAIALFNRKDYVTSSEIFRSLTESKQGATALYYLALCYSRTGHNSEAHAVFERLTQLHPLTAEAGLAKKYLAAAGPAALPVSAAVVKSAQSEREEALARQITKLKESLDGLPPAISREEWQKLPLKSRIAIQRRHGHLWLQAKVNGQSCDLVFDTGATGCTISTLDYPRLVSQEQLSKAKDVMIQRVYGPVHCKQLTCEITVQDITRTIPVIFINEENCSLLGQNFFKEYSYQVDDFYLRLTRAPHWEDAKVATAASTSTSASAAARKNEDRFSLPFELDRDTMLVDIQVNGVTTKACFDTGCAMPGLVCHPSMATKFALTHGGRLAERVIVGHIIRLDVPVNYVMGIDTPLIGPAIFNRPYTVDQASRRIRFDY